MGKPKKVLPDKEELFLFPSKTVAAEHYGVSVRTIARWLNAYGYYDEATSNYGVKLNLDKAREIRRLHAQGQSIKDLAHLYSVTFASISRIIHGITYRESHPDVSDVQVIYNPH